MDEDIMGFYEFIALMLFVIGLLQSYVQKNEQREREMSKTSAILWAQIMEKIRREHNDRAVNKQARAD